MSLLQETWSPGLCMLHKTATEECEDGKCSTLDDAPLEMELDTGAAVSIISKATFKKLWEVTPKLTPTTTRLRNYSG